MRSDDALQREVLEELLRDARVEAAEVGVQVDGGVVTLTGTISTHVKRTAAQEAAHRVARVRDVANDLVVRITGGLAKTDTELAHAVRRALAQDTDIPHERIATTVADGRVTLEGTVDCAYQCEQAALTVARLGGVRGVKNRLVVAGPPFTAELLRAAIEGALMRRADREADHILVSVAGDTVTLTGAVDSWSEKWAVLGAARHTQGVRAVVDQLHVQDSA